ncbi:hypothetical protein BDZ45DRAFT_736806 [Acephala macrosclerotiorum]|nr:hypothetical protein BDZ45DRAFT_736806 [Acephala macrosclerotiorum]
MTMTKKASEKGVDEVARAYIGRVLVKNKYKNIIGLLIHVIYVLDAVGVTFLSDVWGALYVPSASTADTSNMDMVASTLC